MQSYAVAEALHSKRLVGVLHAYGAGCTLSDAREVKMEISG
jgi:hypothetical protein